MRNLFLFIVGLSLFACTNPDANKNDEKTDGIYTVDELKSSFAEHVGEEVTVKGIVKHVCTHGGTKMFIEGDSANIKIMAGESGNFIADEVMYNEVAVTGIVDELVINQDYIMQMEADLEADIADGNLGVEEEGHDEDNPEHEGLDAGAHLDEMSREDAEVSKRQAQIEDVRNMLAESGKESLSFYSVNATSYEVLEIMPKPEGAEDEGCSEESDKKDDEDCDDDSEKDDEDCDGDEDHDHDHNHDGEKADKDCE